MNSRVKIAYKKGMTKEDILSLRKKLEKDEKQQRNEALKKHNTHYNKLKRDLFNICAITNHEWSELAQMCKWCFKQKN